MAMHVSAQDNRDEEVWKHVPAVSRYERTVLSNLASTTLDNWAILNGMRESGMKSVCLLTMFRVEMEGVLEEEGRVECEDGAKIGSAEAEGDGGKKQEG